MSASRPALPPDHARSWLAEVEWRHGARRGRFCVVAHGSGREPEVVAESAALDWPPGDEAAVHAMTDAVRDVEQRLLAAGWRGMEQGDAWYAKRFVWAAVPQDAAERPSQGEQQPAGHANGMQAVPVAEPPGVEEPPDVAEPQNDDQLWRCEIAWDAGYVTSRFVALAFAPGRTRPRPVGASSRLRWLFMEDPDPGTAEHDEAVRALERALVDAGWQPAGQGSRWYAQRFVWRGPGAPPEHVDPEPPAPAGETSAELWRCEIVWQPGYVSSRFVALAYEPGRRRGRQIGASVALRWLFKDDPDPRVAEHPEAVRTLEVALLEAGWDRAGQGSDWYAQRFVWRRGGTPPDHIDQAVAEARPAG